MENNYIYGIKCWDKFPDVTVSIETITPQVAIAMLSRNTHNRDMKRNDKLVEAIKNGDWNVNGETIVFSPEGKLLDGQHRLMSCVTAGVPITTLVVRGIPEGAQETMDTGYKRKVSDFLKMKGYKSATQLAAISNALYIADRYGIKSAMSNGGLKAAYTKKAIEFFEANYETRVKPLYRKCLRTRETFKGITVQITAPLFDAFRSIDVESFDHFYGMLVGEYTPTKALLVLIKRLNTVSESRDSIPKEYVAAYFIKAWNAYINGTELQFLRYQPGGAHPESFPTISSGIDALEVVA